MKTKIISITYINEDGERVTDDVRVRRMKVLERAKLFDDARKDLKPGEVPTGTALVMLQLSIIAQSVVGADDKPLHTVEQINDEWDADKINAYKLAIDEFQKPTVEEAAKNSAATPSDGGSSTSP